MGVDKAFMNWEGEPLWSRQLAKLAGLGAADLLVMGREDQDFEGEGFRVLRDLPGESGPLPALVRCVAAAQMPVLLLGVDLPLMKEEVLAFVLDRSREKRGFVFERDGFYEPMAACYPLGMLPHLEAARTTGRMQQALRAGVAARVLDSAPLPPAFERAFFNANTPDEWKQAQQSR
jgi:molybdopterin-guanine dinucleotide biosynthesis protein A